MKENFVRADGVSYREAVEKCIRHYVMRGYDLKGETERFVICTQNSGHIKN